jgi:hypothetical protein
MRKILIVSFFLQLFLIERPTLSFADTTGFDFLKIGVGARPFALGEAYVALADDINAVYWNPAGLVQLRRQETGFTYNKWFEDIGYYFFGYAYLLNDSAFALSIYYLGTENIEGSDEANNPTGEFSIYDLAFAFSYGRRLTEKLSSGLNFKFAKEKLENEAANAFALDFGVLYKTGINNLNVGLNIQNIGTGIRFIKESAKLPLNWKFGLAYKLFPGSPVTLTLDLNKLENRDIYFGLGGECQMGGRLTLRMGRKFDPQIDDGFRFGLGLRVEDLCLDYAYLPHNILGDTHQFSVSFYFGGPKAEGVMERKEQEKERAQAIASLYQEGMVYFNQKQYIQAIAKFSEVLLLDPENKEAINMMKEANRLLRERE